MPGVLVSIDAWDRVLQSRVTVRVGSARNPKTLGADGYTWEPGLPRRPRFSMQFMDDDLTGVLMVASAELVVDTNQITSTDRSRLDFVGAPVRMYYGDTTSLEQMYQVFVGKVTGGTPDATSGMLPLQCEVNRAYFDVPLLNLTYGGGGGADGDPEIRGTNKPAGFGAPINIRPVLVNAENAVYQVDGYGNTLTIPEVFEDLASFGAPHANYASYAALVAATIPEGRFATCIAEGLFRLGADAAGTITCDATFNGNRPGSMMLRWLQVHAGLSNSFIRVSDFDALTTAVAGVAGHQTPVSFWTQETGNVLDLIQRMCASCNAVPLLMLDGTIGIARVTGGAQVMELRRQGGTPLVTAWQAADSPIPWWRLRMAGAKSFYVNSPAEIDYEDEIRDMGDYQSGETYRQGMVVRSTTDGARYIYINATATSGNAPPNATYWDLYEDAPDATNIKYPSGATLASKEPEEAGANKTETRTSASIIGQGAFATVNTAGYGSSLLTGFGALSPLSMLLLGGTYLRRADGTTLLTDSSVITALGIAASIAGQGYFATQNFADWQTRITGTGKPSDNAGTTVTWYDQNGVYTVQGNRITRATGTGWERIIWTREAYKDTAYISGKLGTDGTFIGIAPAIGAAGADYGVLSHSVHWSASGNNRYAYEGGTQAQNFGSGFSASTVWSVVYDGTRVKYYADGVLLRDVPSGPGQWMYGAAIGYAATNYVTDVAFGPYAIRPDINSTVIDSGNGYTAITRTLVLTSLGTAAAITGQGPGATAPANRVMNNVVEGNMLRIPSPGGGAYSYDGGDITGAIKIRFPIGYTSTMVRFRVEIYNYITGTSVTYEVGGYPSAGAWYNVFASMVGVDSMRRTVRFGNDAGGYVCVWIGENADSWSYPKVRVIDFQAGYSSFTEATWEAGWVVSIGAIDSASTTGTVLSPNAGDARYGLNVLESAGVPATLGNFKTILGTSAAITGQGTLATAPALNRSNILSYFAVNSFSLDYTIKRSDGSTTVTESISITSLGIAAGFTGQGSMATQNASGVAITGGSININNLFTVASDGTTSFKSAASGERVEINSQGVRTYDSAGNWTTKQGNLA